MSQTDDFITVKRKRRTKGKYLFLYNLFRIKNNKLADLLSGDDMYFLYNFIE